MEKGPKESWLHMQEVHAKRHLQGISNGNSNDLDPSGDPRRFEFPDTHLGKTMDFEIFSFFHHDESQWDKKEKKQKKQNHVIVQPDRRTLF